MIVKIISGGQTGADRGGLEAGLKLGLPIGGWCPKGRRAEDGRIPDKYPMREDSSPAYPPRTLANVLEADATVVFYTGDELERGSKLTTSLCVQNRKSCCPLRLDLFTDDEAAFKVIRPWLVELHRQRGPFVLNVAGNRESISPGIQKRTERIIVTSILGFLL